MFCGRCLLYVVVPVSGAEVFLYSQEHVMAEPMSRREAREHVTGMVKRMLDKYIPEDETQPVQEETLWEIETRADEFDHAVVGHFIEALAMVSKAAAIENPGPCPHCRSANTKWLARDAQRERRSKHGPVVLPRAVARCRSCDRSFSPSRLGMEGGPESGNDAAGNGKSLSGGGREAV